MAVLTVPERKLRHQVSRPAAQAGHGGSMPRGTQDSQGFSTTRSPVSARRPTTSCPSTCGNVTSAVSGLSRDPLSKICLTSDPHSPETTVSTRTQSSAGSGGSSTSSSRTGASGPVNARRLSCPATVAAASRARLCLNTKAFITKCAISPAPLTPEARGAGSATLGIHPGRRDAQKLLRVISEILTTPDPPEAYIRRQVSFARTTSNGWKVIRSAQSDREKHRETSNHRALGFGHGRRPGGDRAADARDSARGHRGRHLDEHHRDDPAAG